MIDMHVNEEVSQTAGRVQHSAGNLAARYDRMLTAIDDDGTVDPAASRFATWLADCWRAAGPPEPARVPDAVSTSRAGIQLLRWYAVGTEIRAYVPGGSGCYLIPAVSVEGGL